MLSKGVGRAFDCTADPLGKPNGVMAPRIRQQAGELLTSNPTKEIIGPQLRRRQSTESGKHFVAGMMPVPIVDALKAIEIKHDERRRLACKACPFQQPFACLEETATVGDAS